MFKFSDPLIYRRQVLLMAREEAGSPFMMNINKTAVPIRPLEVSNSHMHRSYKFIYENRDPLITIAYPWLLSLEYWTPFTLLHYTLRSHLMWGNPSTKTRSDHYITNQLTLYLHTVAVTILFKTEHQVNCIITLVWKPTYYWTGTYSEGNLQRLKQTEPGLSCVWQPFSF